MNLFNMDERSEYGKGGVKPRFDGGGDEWAGQHRTAFGSESHLYMMQDFDVLMGAIGFCRDGHDSIFTEIAGDSHKNEGKIIRRFATVAIFERKKNASRAYNPEILNTVQLAYFLDLCRAIGKAQPAAPKFFFVFGECAPWTMAEVDIDTGEIGCLGTGKAWKYGDSNWSSAWSQAGIFALRTKLTRWVEAL